jgi:peptidoglycan/xylan/chitin deacetylase (PgdA/CDA1 family)
MDLRLSLARVRTAALLLLFLSTAPGCITTAASSGGRVALTFDDLPIHSALPPGSTRADIARSIVAALRSANAPPTFGFVNAKGLQDAPETAEFLQIWRAAGHPLGNHAFSHMDLHKNTVEAFEQDIVGGEPVLRAAMEGEDWRWFRYPYLREGDTLEKRHAVAAFLKERGYRVAEVTMSFDDYAYNDPYARCLARGDKAGIEWLKESYLRRAAASLTEGQRGAREIFGHDIPHVMLLHVGGFQMVMLPRLLDLLRERDFTLVTLPEAQSDPSYAADSDVATDEGATLLDRVRKVRRIAPLSPPSPPDGFFAQVGAVCR